MPVVAVRVRIEITEDVRVAADVPGTVFEIDLGPGCASGTAPTVASNGHIHAKLIELLGLA